MKTIFIPGASPGIGSFRQTSIYEKYGADIFLITNEDYKINYKGEV